MIEKPPKHLRPATKAWFSSVLDEYSLEPHHIRLLTLAAESWDRCCEAREALAEHGLTFIDRYGSPRARPEAAIESQSRIAFARLCRELDLVRLTGSRQAPATIALEQEPLMPVKRRASKRREQLCEDAERWLRGEPSGFSSSKTATSLPRYGPSTAIHQ